MFKPDKNLRSNRIILAPLDSKSKTVPQIIHENDEDSSDRRIEMQGYDTPEIKLEKDEQNSGNQSIVQDRCKLTQKKDSPFKIGKINFAPLGDVKRRNTQEGVHFKKIKKQMSITLSMMNAAQFKSILQNKKEDDGLKDYGCLIHPDNSFKVKWDIFIMIILLFSCIITPLTLAFDNDDQSQSWSIVLYTIDILFLFDMTIIFNTMIHDDQYKPILQRSQIAKAYVKSWFLIDLIAIFPTHLLFPHEGENKGEDFNELMRVTRIGRLYKLVKLARLVRILKVARQRSKISQYLTGFLRVGIGFERLFFFIFSSLMLFHIISCLWLMAGKMQSEETWMDSEKYKDMSDQDLYLTALYFTVTTITTVGYGDILAVNPTEKIFCIFIMVIGVISFSFAAGMLTSIIQNYDQQNAQHSQQLIILNKLYAEYEFSETLYKRLQQALIQSKQSEFELNQKVISTLPQNLQDQVNKHIFEQKYSNLAFYQNNSKALISWISTRLQTLSLSDGQYLFFDADEVNNIYINTSGSIGMVLPKYNCIKFIDFDKGHMFGIGDIVGSVIKLNNIKVHDWFFYKDKLKRQCTVMTDRPTTLLSLSIQDLNRLQQQFEEDYSQMFFDAHIQLEKVHSLKIKAMADCSDQQRQRRPRYQVQCFSYAKLQKIDLQLLQETDSFAQDEEIMEDSEHSSNNQSGMPAKRQKTTFLQRQLTLIQKISDDQNNDVRESRHLLQVINKNKMKLNKQQLMRQSTFKVTSNPDDTSPEKVVEQDWDQSQVIQSIKQNLQQALSHKKRQINERINKLQS